MDTAAPTEQHNLNNPLPWWRLRRKTEPTALELASAALEQCRRDRLDHAHQQEFHAGMTAMLAKREARLVQEVGRLSRSKKALADDSQFQE